MIAAGLRRFPRFPRTMLLCLAGLGVTGFAAFSAPPEKGGRVVTFSLRTEDGLVVLDAGEAEIREWKRLLDETPVAPSTSIELFKWLTDRGARADSIRLYAASFVSSESVRIGAHPLAWKKTNVGTAVRSGEIPDITGRKPYEAYMMIRASGERFFILDQSGGSGGGLKPAISRSVFIMSSASGNGIDGIYVDGVNCSKGSKGYNIVAFSPDGTAVSGVGSFDLFSDPDAGGKMAGFLNGMPDGTFIAVAVRHGPGVFLTSDAVEALRGYGSKVYLDPEILASHAMFGRKGWPPGTALEASEVNLGSSVPVYDRSIYVGESQLEELSVEQSGRIVALSGTDEDDLVYILE